MNERGLGRGASGAVLPTRLMVLSISAVALGGLAFFATQGDDGSNNAAPPPSTSSVAPPTSPITQPPGGPQTPTATPTPPKPVNKAKTDVLILNNTNITGLAGKTRTRAERAGWNVIDTGNWQGAVDATTVYYGPGMKAAAQLLAADLDIKRFKPLFATSDLSPKRLNVIITSDYS